MRKILHIDMDAFYASVEQRDNPELRNKPVLVGGRPENRGVVAACSYEARAFGIHSAMPCSRAVKLCPGAIIVPPRFDAYRQASKEIHGIFRQFTQLVEPLSLDEAYLDVTACAASSGSATEVAREIKHEIRKRVSLTASAGVSYNKFLAKIASDVDKPDGLYVIRPETAQNFIDALEIRKFYGVGRVTEKKMQSLGIYHGSDLKKFSKIQLQTHFGRVGSYYYNIARGIDERPVQVSRERKSVSSETTFNEDVCDKKLIWKTLQQLAAGLEHSLQKKHLLARTLTLKVRYSDFRIVTRSHTGASPLMSSAQMLQELPALLQKTEVGVQPIRLIGINLSNLVEQQQSADQQPVNEAQHGANQLGLFS